MRIALDAMGGDFAPGPIIAGALQAVQSDTELSVVLVGDKDQIDHHIQGQPHADRIKIFHCTQAIGMEESPVDDYAVQSRFSAIASLAAPRKSLCSSVKTDANFVMLGSNSSASA